MHEDNENIICAPEDSNIKIIKWRVREGFPVRISQVILHYEYESNEKNNKEIKRLKAHKTGVVKKRLHEEGDIVERGKPILELCECNHATVIKDMCADCGADLRQNENGFSEASVPMIHSIPDLKVTEKLAQKLGEEDTKRLLEDRKLVLLVDLDQTLIHTTNDNVPNNIKGIYHFQLYGPHSPWYHTRLRPRTIEFLNNISQYYELHICTFGARNYAHMIAQILDPDGKFFSHRILSRDECFNVTYKTDNLKALFPCGDSMVCIIDDREDVWNMASNLIQVKPYHFFQHTGDINAPPGLSKHELDGKGIDFKDLKITSSTTTSDIDDKQPKVENNKAVKQNSKVKTTDENEEKQEVNDDEGNSKPVIKIESNKSNEKSTKEEKEGETQNQINCEKVDKDIAKDVKTTNQSIDESVEVEIQETIEQKSENENQQSSSKEQQEQHKEESTDKSDKIESTNPPSPPPSPPSPPPLPPVITAETMQKEQNMMEFIEIEDPDDYLLYLESILTTIHKKFYEIYNQKGIIPDLKILIPQIRSKVLRGLNLVFSGLVPNQMKLEKSRAYLIAKSLGANVTQNLTEDTTHLIAVTVGTFKYNLARKRKDIKIVTPEWLWCCAERWEKVDEELFPLDSNIKLSKARHPPPHCHSPEHAINYNDNDSLSPITAVQSSTSALNDAGTAPEEPKFTYTINPLFSFSNADLAEMNKEFDQFFESDSSSEEEKFDEVLPIINKALKRKREYDEDDEERKCILKTEDSTCAEEKPKDDTESDQSEYDGDIDDDGNDDKKSSSSSLTISEKFRRGEDLPSDYEYGSDNSQKSGDPIDDEDDGEWNMMGAALEREFLGLEK